MTSWTEFRSAFLFRFSPSDTSRIARLKLHTVEQRSSVADYNAAFFNQMELIHDMSAADQVMQYILGLKQNIRNDVDRENPTTLTDAMHLAQRDDTRMYNLNRYTHNHMKSRSGYGGGRSNNSYQQTSPMELGSMDSEDTYGEEEQKYDVELDQLNAFMRRNGPSRPSNSRPTPPSSSGAPLTKLTPEEREKCVREGRCFRCRQTGHQSRECPKYPSSSTGGSRHSKA